MPDIGFNPGNIFSGKSPISINTGIGKNSRAERDAEQKIKGQEKQKDEIQDSALKELGLKDNPRAIQAIGLKSSDVQIIKDISIPLAGIAREQKRLGNDKPDIFADAAKAVEKKFPKLNPVNQAYVARSAELCALIRMEGIEAGNVPAAVASLKAWHTQASAPAPATIPAPAK